MIRFKSRKKKIIALTVLVLWIALIAGIGFGLKSLVRKERHKTANVMTGGDAALGLVTMERYGCAACHQVPGLPSTGPVIGPPLTGKFEGEFARQILGENPEQLVRWIMNPVTVDPTSKMPNLGVKETDARNIAAYLYAQK